MHTYMCNYMLYTYIYIYIYTNGGAESGRPARARRRPAGPAARAARGGRQPQGGA